MTDTIEPANRSVYVAAVGATTSVGRDAWSSAAAARAGLSSFAQHRFMVDRSGKPMAVAAAPWVDQLVVGQERFETLLHPAVAQVVGVIGKAAAKGSRVAAAIALPPARPGLPPDLAEDVRRGIARQFGDTFAAIALFATGHAAGLIAIQACAERIRHGAFDACVVAGVDSYLMPETLEWLDDTDRLHGAGRPGNPWGFVPGEGAGAVLLASDSFIQQLKIPPLASVLSVGVAFEHNRAYTQTVCIGEGLSGAFAAGLEKLPATERVTDIFCDMNGEPYRGDEYGFASLRVRSALVDPADFVAAADCWGDVSAASAPLAVMLSVIAGRKGYANGRHALIWASSEGGERSAALLELL